MSLSFSIFARSESLNAPRGTYLPIQWRQWHMTSFCDSVSPPRIRRFRCLCLVLARDVSLGIVFMSTLMSTCPEFRDGSFFDPGIF